MRFLSIFLFLSIFFSVHCGATEYQVDVMRSDIGFVIKHIFTKVHGEFTQFKGTFTIDDLDLSIKRVAFTIYPNSINTQNEDRDGILKGRHFFDVSTYPEITFVGKSTRKTGSNYDITGDLKMHGVTKRVVFKAEDLGSEKNTFGQTMARFTATTTIDRYDFGLVWNQTLDTGGVLVDNSVKITVDLEASPIPKAIKPKNLKR